MATEEKKKAAATEPEEVETPDVETAEVAEESVDVLGFQNNKGMFLTMSFNFEPWNLPGNEKLRQAVALAMPYQEIIDADFGGDALKWQSAVSSLYYGYSEGTTYETDIEAAQALVAEFLAENNLEDLSSFSGGFEMGLLRSWAWRCAINCTWSSATASRPLISFTAPLLRISALFRPRKSRASFQNGGLGFCSRARSALHASLIPI